MARLQRETNGKIGRPSQNLVFVDNSDSDSETSGRPVKCREGRKRGRKRAQFRESRSLNSEVEGREVNDSEVANRNSPKKKAKAKANNPVTKKLLKALATAAELLSDVESEEVIEEWMAGNVFDEDHLTQLRTSCIAIAQLLRIKAPGNREAADGESAEPVREDYFVYRASSKEVMLLAPVEIFKCTSNYGNKKVLGFIRRPNEPIMMNAFPGWTACALPHKRLLDSLTWTNYVKEFARLHDHRFRHDGFDSHNSQEVGTSFASHVECKLMLFFATRLMKKRLGEDFNLRKLYLLHQLQSGNKAEIVISDEPCQGCKEFQKVIELVTGVKFTIKATKNLGQLKASKKAGRQKVWAEDTNSDTDLDNVQEHIISHQRISSAMVVINPTKPVLLTPDTEPTTPTKARSSKQEFKSIPPERQAPTTANRKKRQYEDTDDEEEYTPTRPGRRLSSKSLPMRPNVTRTRERIMSASASAPLVYQDVELRRTKFDGEKF